MIDADQTTEIRVKVAECAVGRDEQILITIGLGSCVAIVLHDADSLDFLGDIGAARLIALTGAKGPSFAPAVKTLRGFLKDIPPKLITRTARKIGLERTAELQAFLDRLQAESFAGNAM